MCPGSRWTIPASTSTGMSPGSASTGVLEEVLGAGNPLLERVKFLAITIALALGATTEYFRDAVFNFRTMAEAYKVAALDGLNKLQIALP